MRQPLLPLLGYSLATWPGHYPPDQVIGITIATHKFEDKGILFNDFGVILKCEYTQIHYGDIVAFSYNSRDIYLDYYRPGLPNIVGKLLRTWRNY